MIKPIYSPAFYDYAFTNRLSADLGDHPLEVQLAERSHALIRSELKQKKYIKQPPKVCFGFYDSEEFDAKAVKYLDGYVVRFSNAVPHILCDLFARMLSHKKILRHIGSPDLEEYDTPLMNDYHLSYKDMVESSVFDGYFLPLPRCPVRKKYSQLLVALSFDYLLNHEMSHIVFGHLDYKHIYMSKNQCDELPKDINQALEMDADATAVARCLSFVRAIHKEPERVDLSIREFYTDLTEVIATMTFAIESTLRFLKDYRTDDVRIAERELGQHNDLPMRLRQLHASALVSKYREVYLPNLDEEALSNKVSKAIVESEAAYVHLTGRQGSKEWLIEDSYGRNPINNELLKKWEQIVPDLEPYAYKSLLRDGSA